ncbi:MAG TPA: glycosyltransferase family 4 protein [Candidatus Limnocylindria bacterium]|nr:glycosyltransferase family 4 protein [Candidatus Limnocylindria bacterium]
MEILVISWNYPPRRGGIETLISNLCGRLRQKHRVFVVTSFAKAGRSDEEDTFRAPLPGLISFGLCALWRASIILARNERIRVVFGGSALVTPLVLILARLFRRRAAVLTHGLDVIHRNFFYQMLCVRWLKYCDRVVANSNYTASLVKVKGVAQERLAVIPPGIDVGRFSGSTDVAATKRQWSIEDKKIILFVGRLAKRKGIKEFIENSLVEILREIPEAVFLIAGDNPTESLAHRDDVVGEIQPAVSRLGLDGQVRLLGAVDDDELIKLYHASDVVVLPALDMKDDIEGFGIVALEAAAAGKPVVATRVGGIADAVENGKSGILVEPECYEDLSRTVAGLLRNFEFRTALGLYGHCRASQKFSWHYVIGSYEGMMADWGSQSTIR